MPKPLRNSCRCRKCGDEIESKHRHDWVSCKCGAVFTDGGLDYVRRGGDLESIEDTSRYAPLLVGEANPYSGLEPRFALYPYPENSAGGRLCRYVLGMGTEEYVRRFDRVNLCGWDWKMKEARAKADEILADVIRLDLTAVLCGAKVAKAFGLTSVTAEEPARLHHNVGGGLLVLIPHPSGLCRYWNDPNTVMRVRATLVDAGVLEGDGA